MTSTDTRAWRVVRRVGGQVSVVAVYRSGAAARTEELHRNRKLPQATPVAQLWDTEAVQLTASQMQLAHDLVGRNTLLSGAFGELMRRPPGDGSTGWCWDRLTDHYWPTQVDPADLVPVAAVLGYEIHSDRRS